MTINTVHKLDRYSLMDQSGHNGIHVVNRLNNVHTWHSYNSIRTSKHKGEQTIIAKILNTFLKAL